MARSLPWCGVIGYNGNTMALLAHCYQALKSSGFRREGEDLRRIMLAGDRDHALQVMTSFIVPGEYADEISDCAPENEPYKFHQTELHLANSAPATAALLASGSDVNAENCYGRTPLFYARTAEQVEVLLAAGADPLVTDIFGMTVAHMLTDHAAMASYVRALGSARETVAASRSTFGETPDSVAVKSLADAKTPAAKISVMCLRQFLADGLPLALEKDFATIVKPGGDWCTDDLLKNLMGIAAKGSGELATTLRSTFGLERIAGIESVLLQARAPSVAGVERPSI